jgi:hypothetical protein
VQAANPHAGRARTALAAGLATLAGAADHGAAGDFAAILERAQQALGPDGDAYSRICEQLFVVARPPAPESAALTSATTGGAGRHSA